MAQERHSLVSSASRLNHGEDENEHGTIGCRHDSPNDPHGIRTGAANGTASVEASSEGFNRPACLYQVTEGNPGVYEKPTRISTLLARKRPPAQLDATYCMRYENTQENLWYVSVNNKKTRDNIGWIRADRVIRIR